MGGKLVFAKKDGLKADGSKGDRTWKLLVVDDDPEVHAVTRLSLRTMRYGGQGVEILSAHSGAEAARILAERDDIAIILLDVVMETEDAGLRLVTHIRDELKNHFVRIILRTGQPGQAPEERVIVDYDINDYKAKTELTSQKLFTATLTALRAYADIMRLESHRRGLRQIIDTSDSLLKIRSLHQFAEGVLTQLGTFLGVGANGILCVQRRPVSAPDAIVVLAATPEYGTDPESSLEAVPVADEVTEAIRRTFETRANVHGSDFSTFYLGDGADHEIVAYLHCPPPEDSLTMALVQLFCTKISVGFRNLYLYQQVTAMNAELERKVEERTRALEEANRTLERLAATDPLTGAFNRRRFMDAAGRDVERAHRNGTPLAVAMLDLDHFKAINDTYGHAAGDAVLVETVRRAGLAMRTVDVLGRLGGEEFAVLLPDADAEGALRAAERLREAVAAAPVTVPAGTPVPVTASIGVAILASDESLDHLLSRADAALYCAKTEGRDRVVMG